MMIDLNDSLNEWVKELKNCKSLEDLSEFRNKYLSKKGIVAGLMASMRDLPNDQKPAFGSQVNQLKQTLEKQVEQLTQALEAQQLARKLQSEAIDLSLPGVQFNLGAQNPLVSVQRELEDVFREMGYLVVEGDEVEYDLYNFERANIPPDHPARDMQDTFYITEQLLLRTHTTAVQTRTLESYAPSYPIKVVCPGKVYRRDDDDATHSHQFTQMEGLVVGKGITISDLKGTLELMAKRVLGDKRRIRFRPSYFQFTEPSVEVDVSCHICDGKGCSTCKHTGWIEILGAGMVHPAVLEMAGYSSDDNLTGFAFGLGIERVALLKYGIEDIRLLYQNDLRFLKQFERFE